jgi:hypothetical protein
MTTGPVDALTLLGGCGLGTAPMGGQIAAVKPVPREVAAAAQTAADAALAAAR